MFLGTQDLKFYNSVDIFDKAIFRHIHIENYHTIISTLCFHVTILNRLNFLQKQREEPKFRRIVPDIDGP